MKTVFEKIIDKELPATVVYEDENLIAFHDIAPKAPVHILIVTKKVIPSIQEMQKEDLHLLNDIAQVAQKLAEELGIEKGYRLLTNVGEDAGQTIFHLHFHLIGGAPLGEMA